MSGINLNNLIINYSRKSPWTGSDCLVGKKLEKWRTVSGDPDLIPEIIINSVSHQIFEQMDPSLERNKYPVPYMGTDPSPYTAHAEVRDRQVSYLKDAVVKLNELKDHPKKERACAWLKTALLAAVLIASVLVCFLPEKIS